MGVTNGNAASSAPDRLRRNSGSPAVSALLSLLVPGAGQMRQGDMRRGLAWFGAVEVCYVGGVILLVLSVAPLAARALLILGIVLHLVSVVHAARSAREGTVAASGT
jgi:hypothetical protein